MKTARLLRCGESLHAAMHKMVESNQDELVVVADDDPTQIIGTLSRRDLIAAYDHRIQARWNVPPSRPSSKQ